jgi:hypothetical protein
MRIRELLEGKKFNDLDFVKKDGDKTDIDYDLTEDLVFYMNNDDDVYRRVVYPSVVTCTDRLENNRKTTPSIFTNAVKESYKQYLKKFPMRQLPLDIDEEVCKEACEKMHEEICQHHSDNNLKD